MDNQSKKYRLLKEYFGHESFRGGQEKIVDSLLSGRDALCIMPTGAGKSVCYQIPALIFDGVTIVVSPLISLMKDQVNSLTQSGVRAAYLNSSLNFAQLAKAQRYMAENRYKIVYVAPERLLTPDFINVCNQIKISMVAVDEAHCVSQWGQDFRPSYIKIAEFINNLPARPVVGAFTATATAQVKSDIARLLELRSPLSITTGFDRPNLYFGVINPQNKDTELIKLLSERKNSSGIIYCATRKAVEEVCDKLNSRGFSAARYHAGLSDDERRKNQEDFVYDRISVMVATNAFGMGIDKSNVAFVIHYNMPKCIESYYQEAGRAGRDGSKADCIILYSPQDVHMNKFLIEQSEPNEALSAPEQEEIRKRDLDRLKSMTYYCASTDCLRMFILKYFGEEENVRCNNCSNCLTNFETVDITYEAGVIISCIAEVNQHFGAKMICDILRGSRNERLLSFGLDKKASYGLLASVSEKRVRLMINTLIDGGYIKTDDGEYPVLKFTELSREAASGELVINMTAPKEIKKKTAPTPVETDVDAALMSKLRELRKKLAANAGVPAYVIFSDAALYDMCRKMPADSDEFLEVSGVGRAKLKSYGRAFLKVINENR